MKMERGGASNAVLKRINDYFETKTVRIKNKGDRK